MRPAECGRRLEIEVGLQVSPTREPDRLRRSRKSTRDKRNSNRDQENLAYTRSEAMLSETDKKGARKLLTLLDTGDLLSLAKTVTKNRCNVSDRRGAISAILEFSESGSELLARQRIKVELLVQHLRDQKYEFNIKASKPQLIDSVMDCWKVSSPPPRSALVQASSPLVASTYQQPAPLPQMPASVTINTYHLHQNTVYNQTNVASPAQLPSPEPSLPSLDTDALAREFIHWFFNLWNSSDASKFTADNFCSNCSVAIRCLPSQAYEEKHGAAVVAERLLAFVVQENFTFTANDTSEGTEATSDNFGRVVVNVCGIVNRCQTYVGIFKAQFGLVKDASWKIAYVQLLLVEHQTQKLPTLSFMNSLE